MTVPCHPWPRHSPPTHRNLLPDGRVLFTTLSSAGHLTVRLHGADGAAVAGFGEGGQACLNVGLPGHGYLPLPLGVTSHADGDTFLIGLSCRPNHKAAWHALVLRLDPRGQPRFAFSTTPNEFHYPGMHSLLTDLAVLPDGKVLVCGVRWAEGDHRYYGFLARLGRDCQLDNAYGQEGFAWVRGLKGNNAFARLSPPLEHGGRWLVGVSAVGRSPGNLLTVTALDPHGAPQPGYAGLLPVEAGALQVDAIELCPKGHALINGTLPGKGTFIAGLLPSGRFDGRLGRGAAIEWSSDPRRSSPVCRPVETA